jgi:hypothetical protein
MKRIVLILLSICFLQLSAQEYFFEFIPGWRAIAPIEYENGYEIIGFTSTEPQQNHVMISELSSDGVLVDQLEFDFNSESVRNIQFLQVNSHISEPEYRASAGSIRFEDNNELAGIIVRWNSDYSDTLRTHILQLDSATSFRSIQKVDIDLLLLTAYVQEFSLDIYTSLLLIDTLGNIQWRQDFYCDDLPASICRLQPIHTLQCPDGGYLLTCRQVRTNNSCNFPVSSTLIKTDAQGNEEWRTRPGPHETFYVEPGWPVLLDNGNIMFFWTNNFYDPPPVDGCWQINDSSTVRFAEFELTNGQLIQEGGYVDILPNVYNGLDAQLYYLSQAQQLSNGSIILSGGNYTHAFIAKVSQEGELLWYRTHLPEQAENEGLGNGEVTTYIYGLIETSDGGFLGVGEFQVNPFFSDTWPDGFQTAFALKLDEYGCQEPGCQLVGIPDYVIQDSRLRVYPNPLSGAELNIRFPQEVQVERVDLVDAVGRIIPDSKFKIQGSYSDNLESAILNLEFLAPGLYSLLITTRDGSVYSGKVIVE